MTDEEFLNQPPQWRPQGVGELRRLIELAREAILPDKCHYCQMKRSGIGPYLDHDPRCVMAQGLAALAYFKWKPIQEAPKAKAGEKHGPEILGIDESGNQEKCWWETYRDLCEWVTCGGLTFYPTHFMLLPPPPPKEKQCQEKI